VTPDRQVIVEAMRTALTCMEQGRHHDVVTLLGMTIQFLIEDQALEDRQWIADNVGEYVACQ
jgi:hypothetical protein